MTNLYGTGTNGKRLWMRSGDNRWIEIPYGAGQDSNVRSVNVWNAKLKKWMTPVWGWSVWNIEGQHQQDIDAFDVRMPDRNWRGASTASNVDPVYNPIYISKRSAAKFTYENIGWVRFFHLRPRVDPNWRIVALGQPLPFEVPNKTISFDSRFHFFWPSTGLYSRFRRTQRGVQGAEQIDHSATPAMGSGTPYLTQTIIGATDTSKMRSTVNANEQHLSGMIDLKAIRKRIEDKYSEQGTDYTGQYHPIKNMKLRRVYVTYDFAISIYQYGPNPSEQAHNNCLFRIFAKQAAPAVSGTYTDDLWPQDGSYEIRSPTTDLPLGSMLFLKSGATLDRRVGTTLDIDRNTLNTLSGSYSETGVTVMYEEGLEEDNISFFSSIENLPQLSGSVYQWGVQLDCYATRISLHYATDGNDTPESLRRWDAIT